VVLGVGLKESDQVVLFTDFDVQECQRRLSAELDEKRWRPWRLWASGYEGSKEMLGWVRGHSFSLRPRRYARNWIAPTFYGRMYPQRGRTRIDGYFERLSWTGIEAEQFFELVSYAFVLALLLFSYLSDASRGIFPQGPWLALIVFSALVVYLFWYVKRAVCRTRPEVLEFLQSTLMAQIEPRQ
jgi:hypothetical protein